MKTWTCATLDVRRLPLTLDAEEVSALLNRKISGRTVRRMAAKGEIPAMQVGSRWLFPTEKIIERFFPERMEDLR